MDFQSHIEEESDLNVHQSGEEDISSLTKEWDFEVSYFEMHELFTILGCLFIKPRISIAYSLKQVYNESRTKSTLFRSFIYMRIKCAIRIHHKMLKTQNSKYPNCNLNNISF